MLAQKGEATTGESDGLKTEEISTKLSYHNHSFRSRDNSISSPIFKKWLFGKRVSRCPQHETGDSTSVKYTCVPLREKL
jgi:hypothetical protein